MSKKDSIDETLVSSPIPRASSTVQKPNAAKQYDLKPVLLSYSSTPERLTMDSLESKSRGNDKLLQQRILSNNLLHRAKSFGLPSRYLRESDSIKSSASSSRSDSTINETDLLTSHKTENAQFILNHDEPVKEEKSIKISDAHEKLSFQPAEISTPRNSSIGYENFNSNTISQSLVELSKQLQMSDFSLTELCEQFCKNIDIDNSKVTEDSFIPGELAEEKFSEQEKLWQQKYGVLGDRSTRDDSMLSQIDPNSLINNVDRMSVSEFFKKKSELAEMCLKRSPSKSKPKPLIDISSINSYLESSDFLQYQKAPVSQESSLSVSEIAKVIAANDNTNNIMDYMYTKGSKESRKKSSVTKETLTKFNAEYKENQTPGFSLEGSFLYPINSTEKDTLKDSQNVLNDKTLSSIQTISSLDSLIGGKLPIECNRTELVWGCVKIGYRQIQTFIVRNKSQNKLRLQISSSSSNFKILNDHSEADPVLLLPVLLYPAESRSISVMFTPTTLGAFIDKLQFSPLNSDLQQKQTKRQVLMMFGYGGSSNLQIENVLKDTNMKMWLSLGTLNNACQVSQNFTVCNTGNLSAFCCLSFKSKTLFGCSKINLYPNDVILKPKERVKITVSYVPSKEDAKQMFSMANSSIFEMGFVHIMTGEEILRGRIRRMCEKLKQNGGVIGNPLIEKLSGRFVNEDIPYDVCKFTETVASMKELMQQIVSKEIILTMEKDLECPLIGQIAGIDDTSVFYSLCEGMSTTLSTKTFTNSCVVEPTSLILKPPMKFKDFLIITNNSSADLKFKVNIKPEKVLEVRPLQGNVSAKDNFMIEISCSVNKFNRQEVVKIFVYVDDDVFEVTVKIIPDGSLCT